MLFTLPFSSLSQNHNKTRPRTHSLSLQAVYFDDRQRWVVLQSEACYPAISKMSFFGKPLSQKQPNWHFSTGIHYGPGYSLQSTVPAAIENCQHGVSQHPPQTTSYGLTNARCEQPAIRIAHSDGSFHRNWCWDWLSKSLHNRQYWRHQSISNRKYCTLATRDWLLC